MIDDPEASAIRRRVLGEIRFFMTGPGGICNVLLFPAEKWVVLWTGAEVNWGEFIHQDLTSAIRRALDLGCNKVEVTPEVDDERMKRIWELTLEQANFVQDAGRVYDT